MPSASAVQGFANGSGVLSTSEGEFKGITTIIINITNAVVWYVHTSLYIDPLTYLEDGSRIGQFAGT
jgi:hypothetical protein